MKTRTKAELLLIAVTFIWGSTFAVTKSALQSISPFLCIAVRFWFGGLLFALLLPRAVRTTTKTATLKGFILGLLLFAGFGFQTVGLQFTTASKSAFLTGMLVVLTPICQLVIERRPPKVGNVAGVILVSAGLYLLTSPKGAEFNIGDLLTLGCAFCFAIYIVCLDIFAKQHDVEHLSLVQFFTSAVLGTIGAVLFEQPRLNFEVGLVLSLAHLTIFATVIALFVQTKYQKETTPTRAAIIFSLEPVIAAVIAYFALAENIGWAGVLGAILIVAGLLVSELSEMIFSPDRDVIMTK